MRTAAKEGRKALGVTGAHAALGGGGQRPPPPEAALPPISEQGPVRDLLCSLNLLGEIV